MYSVYHRRIKSFTARSDLFLAEVIVPYYHLQNNRFATVAVVSFYLKFSFQHKLKLRLGSE